MIEQLNGPLRCFSVTQGSGAGGSVTCELRPPEGELWLARIIKAKHDDAAGLTVNWRWRDAIGPVDEPAATGTAIPRYFNNDHSCSGAIFPLHHNCYIAFNVQGMAAGKTITITMFGERITGIPTMDAA